MRKIIFLILLCFLSCKRNEKIEIDTLPVKTIDSLSTKVDANNIVYYVNAQSGLNYRSSPKGTILGKFENNSKLNIVKRTNIFEEINDDQKKIKGEWVGVKLENDTVYVFDAFLSLTKVFTGVWSKFPLKKMPFIDSTNFDNIKYDDILTASDLKQLKLKKIYPDIDNEYYNYKFFPSYKLDLGDFNSIVINVLKGDHELEAVLIIYDKDHKLQSYD